MLDNGLPREPDSNQPEPTFEAYKLIVEDLSRVREQRVRAIGGYITINSVILAASALLLRETEFVISWQALIIAPLLIAGVVVSLQWMALVPVYDTLVNVRVGSLERLEANPAMPSHIPRLFTEETRELARPARDDRRPLMLLLERIARYLSQVRMLPVLLPTIFLVLYLIALVSVAAAVGSTILDSIIDSPGNVYEPTSASRGVSSLPEA